MHLHVGQALEGPGGGLGYGWINSVLFAPESARLCVRGRRESEASSHQPCMCDSCLGVRTPAAISRACAIPASARFSVQPWIESARESAPQPGCAASRVSRSLPDPAAQEACRPSSGVGLLIPPLWGGGREGILDVDGRPSGQLEARCFAHTMPQSVLVRILFLS